MTLYKIEQAILDCIDAETGEIIDFEQLERLSIDRQTKIDNIASWYKQLNAESAAIEHEMKMLVARNEIKKNKANSLKHYLAELLCGTKFESARNKISWRTSNEVCIINEAVIPCKYKRTITEMKVSKADIKKAIKDGFIVEGAELVCKNNIQIK